MTVSNGGKTEVLGAVDALLRVAVDVPAVIAVTRVDGELTLQITTHVAAIVVAFPHPALASFLGSMLVEHGPRPLDGNAAICCRCRRSMSRLNGARWDVSGWLCAECALEGGGVDGN